LAIESTKLFNYTVTVSQKKYIEPYVISRSEGSLSINRSILPP